MKRLFALAALVVLSGAAPTRADDGVADDHMVGRSWGCPAVRPKVAKPLIDAIKGGSAVWIYYPDENWLEESEFLDEE